MASLTCHSRWSETSYSCPMTSTPTAATPMTPPQRRNKTSEKFVARRNRELLICPAFAEMENPTMKKPKGIKPVGKQTVALVFLLFLIGNAHSEETNGIASHFD